ncbi:organic cation transporter protein-like isoform X2 [Lineus longissimus]|uniref:organic cation transporter protein-like isoform X2 n=1 Tax=Lineus longissimus TaxID=88925 RepID=UPI00315CF752
MTLDDVLVRHIGHFGRFQGVALFLTVLSSLPAGWHILAYIFISGGTQDYWCALPTGSFGNASQEQLKDIFIPSEIKNGKRKFSSCEIYDFDIKNVSKFTLNILRSGDLVNGSDVRGNISDRRRCVQWEYENNGRYSSSILTQYELYCEKEWLIPVSQSCIMAGWLLGNFVFGSLADRFGRMRVIPVGFLMTFVIGLIMPFIPNYYAYLLFRFFLGVTTGGSYTVCFVLLLEYCGTKHRVLSNISFHGGFNGAVVLLSGIAYAMAPVNHITMQIILGCVPFCMIFYKFILVESPRWLVSNQQYDEARKNIRKIAKFNGRPLADDVVLAFPQDRALINGELEMMSEHPEKKYTVLDLFRTPNIRRATLASYVQWFACSFIFYGLIFIGGSLGANVYINTAISGLCGVVGGFASLPVLKYLGRRTTGVSSLFIMTISLFASIFLIGKPENLIRVRVKKTHSNGK